MRLDTVVNAYIDPAGRNPTPMSTPYNPYGTPEGNPYENSAGSPPNNPVPPAGQPQNPGVYYPAAPGPVDNLGGYAPSPAPYAAAASYPRNDVAPWALGVTLTAIFLTFSVFGALFSWLVALVGLALSIAAIVRAKNVQGPFQRIGVSVTALILSILHVLGIVVIFAVFFLVFQSAVTSPSSVLECYEQYTNSYDRDECVQKVIEKRQRDRVSSERV